MQYGLKTHTSKSCNNLCDKFFNKPWTRVILEKFHCRSMPPDGLKITFRNYYNHKIHEKFIIQLRLFLENLIEIQGRE